MLGYDKDEDGLRSFDGAMKECVDALLLAATLPVQACDIMVKVSTAFEKALEDAGRVYLKWVSSQMVDTAFPNGWLPTDSIALRPLEHTLQTAERVADNTTDLPFCAKRTNTTLTSQGDPLTLTLTWKREKASLPRTAKCVGGWPTPASIEEVIEVGGEKRPGKKGVISLGKKRPTNPAWQRAGEAGQLHPL